MSIRDFVIRVAGVYVALNGLVFGVTALIVDTIGWQLVVVVLMLTVPLAVFIVWVGSKLSYKHILRRSQIPKRDWIPRFRTAGMDDIPRICQLERQVFGYDDALPEHVGYEWLSANSKCLRVMLDKNDNISGYFLLLPLKEHAWEAFIKGTIRIIDVPGNWLHSESTMWRLGSIYVGSFVVTKRIPYAISHMLFYTALVLEDGRKRGLKRIYALGATSEGLRLIRDRYRFQKVSSSSNRIDKHDLYMKDINRIKPLTEMVLTRLLE